MSLLEVFKSCRTNKLKLQISRIRNRLSNTLRKVKNYFLLFLVKSARVLEGEKFQACLIKYCKKMNSWEICQLKIEKQLHLMQQRKRELSSPFFIDSIMFFSSEFRKKLDSFRIYQFWVRSLWGGKYFLTLSGIIISTDWRLIQKRSKKMTWIFDLRWWPNPCFVPTRHFNFLYKRLIPSNPSLSPKIRN